MTVSIAWSVGKSIGVGGTVRAGDAFWVDFDPKITMPNGTMPLYDANGTEISAHVTVSDVAGSPTKKRAQFILTNYVEGRAFTGGDARWQVNFTDQLTPPGLVSFDFAVNTQVFTDGVSILNAPPAQGEYVLPKRPSVTSQFSALSQDEINWFIMGGVGPDERVVVEAWAPTDTYQSALWVFDCTNPPFGFLVDRANTQTPPLTIDRSSTCTTRIYSGGD